MLRGGIVDDGALADVWDGSAAAAAAAASCKDEMHRVDAFALLLVAEFDDDDTFLNQFRLNVAFSIAS